jgi:hypothetical protein
LNYYISRNGQTYGPYSLADLQRYVASGNVLLTDLARSEGMTDWVPVSQVVGNIPVPVNVAAPPIAQAPSVDYPDPPNLHWGIVLLLTVITCGLFAVVWNIVLASWMKKVQPESRALYWYIAQLGLAVVAVFAGVGVGVGIGMHVVGHSALSGLDALIRLCSFVLAIIGAFSMKASMEEHFNTAEPMGLSLSGVMTFFFGCLYFQYHFNDIVKIKQINRMKMLVR